MNKYKYFEVFKNELLGKNLSDISPLFQTNGIKSIVKRMKN